MTGEAAARAEVDEASEMSTWSMGMLGSMSRARSEAGVGLASGVSASAQW